MVFTDTQDSYSSAADTSNAKMKIRLIVLGDHGVGKSAFVSSFVQGKAMSQMSGQFKAGQSQRRSAATFSKTVSFGDRAVDLIIQDTAGQERFRSLTTSYYRNVNCCLLFFNVHNKKSFDNLLSWLDDIERYCQRPDVGVVLVGITNRIPGYLSKSPEFSNNTHDSPFRKRAFSGSGMPSRNSVNNGNNNSQFKAFMRKYTNPRKTDIEMESSSNTTEDEYKHMSSNDKQDTSEQYRSLTSSYSGEAHRSDNIRAVSKEQAQNFAYARQIPYREVDFENDYESIEAVLSRVLDVIVCHNRRSSLDATGVDWHTITLASTANEAGRTVVYCCPCSA